MSQQRTNEEASEPVSVHYASIRPDVVHYQVASVLQGRCTAHLGNNLTSTILTKKAQGKFIKLPN